VKRSSMIIAGLLLAGNLLVFEWVAWLLYTGELDPMIDQEELFQPGPVQR